MSSSNFKYSLCKKQKVDFHHYHTGMRSRTLKTTAMREFWTANVWWKWYTRQRIEFITIFKDLKSSSKWNAWTELFAGALKMNFILNRANSLKLLANFSVFEFNCFASFARWQERKYKYRVWQWQHYMRWLYEKKNSLNQQSKKSTQICHSTESIRIRLNINKEQFIKTSIRQRNPCRVWHQREWCARDVRHL